MIRDASARCRERVRSLHDLGRGTTLPAPPQVHQPRSSPNAILRGFYGRFLTEAQLIKSLATED